MKNLNKEQFYLQLKQVEDMASEKHEDYEVQLLLADLWFAISEGHIWQILKIKWREWKIIKAIKRHKNCCDLG